MTFLERWTVQPHNQEYERELEQFTRQTGIQVNLLPSPETTREQLALSRQLLGTGASSPDVYAIDVISPGILNQYFIDLKPYFADEIPAFFPAMVASYTVNGKLVALPYRSDLGLLFYRTDLLRQYGYRGPPKTWDELESMARRIQAGERAKGKKEFWGFVWEGAAAEALTCNALEWQAAEGGGQIIEDNKTVSVNNPQAIQTWQRAARWVGSISPPSVVAYKEWDAVNAWVAGDAAFMRNWPTANLESVAPESPIRNKFDVSVLPAGRAGQASTLGGTGLAVSRFSAHPREALELVQYLTSRDVQMKHSRVLSVPPTRSGLYELPQVLEPNPFFRLLPQVFRTGLVVRPADVTGKRYEGVSEAYIQAVHSVLTRKQTAPEAAAALEQELIRITGFKKGPPIVGPTHQ